MANPTHSVRHWRWPKDAYAAVSLTYDDGNENNLEQAIPDLEDAGLRGTFYLPVGRDVVIARKADWQAAHQRGHEIGNHTVTHPCRRDAYPPGKGNWIKNPLEEYTPRMIADEVRQAACWLNAEIGLDPHRTFAYPCGAVAIGASPDEASYDRAVRAFHPAARVGGDCVNLPEAVNLLRIQSFASVQPPIASLIGYCKQALKTNAWAVIMFHGIGGPTHTTARQVHQALMRHLNTQPYWVAPLREVVQYIEGRR